MKWVLLIYVTGSLLSVPGWLSERDCRAAATSALAQWGVSTPRWACVARPTGE